MIEYRRAIAEATHHAVCSVTASDGYGHCDLYALAGAHLLGGRHQIQVGSFLLLADPEHGLAFEIDCSDGGLDRLEYHAWIGNPASGEIVDLSTRHLRRMVEQMQYVERAEIRDGLVIKVLHTPETVIRWTRPDDPPSYLWFAGEMPEGYRYRPDIDAMRDYYARRMPNARFLADLYAEARSELRKG